MTTNNLLRITLWLAIGVGIALGLLGSIRVYAVNTSPPQPEIEDISPIQKPFPSTKSSSPQDWPKPQSLQFTAKRLEQNKTKLQLSKKAEVKQIQETKLPLELVGIAYVDRGKSLATLRHLKSRNKKILEVGESWKNFEIRKIEEDAVEIWNQNQKRVEVLRLKRNTTGMTFGNTKEKKGTKAKKVSRYQINKSINNNMNNLLSSVEPAPYLENGKIIGFKIKDMRGEPGKLLKKLGFREGDVITRINGNKVNSVNRAMTLWTQLRNQTEFDILIKRDGKTHKLEYSLTR
ncbi:MAG: PDZ domain-containing protein [bacterium]